MDRLQFKTMTIGGFFSRKVRPHGIDRVGPACKFPGSNPKFPLE